MNTPCSARPAAAALNLSRSNGMSDCRVARRARSRPVEPSAEACSRFNARSRSSVFLPQQPVQFFAMGTAQRQSCAIAQDDRIFPVKQRLQLLDALDVDDRRAADSYEFTGGQPALQGGHRLTMQVGFASHVKVHVIVRSFNPVDFVELQDQNLPAGLDG